MTAKYFSLTGGSKRRFRTRFAARWRLHCILRQLGLAVLLLIGAGFAEALAAGGKSTEMPFTPLHVYYISPSGNDHRAGKSLEGAWATPHHQVNCGDVIIVVAGNYTKSFGINNWGEVSNCRPRAGASMEKAASTSPLFYALGLT